MPSFLSKKTSSSLTIIQGVLLATPLIFTLILVTLINFLNAAEPKSIEKSELNFAEYKTPNLTLVDKIDKNGESFFSESQKKEIGTIIHNYLMENPTILNQVGELLAQRQYAELEVKRKEIMNTYKDEILNSPMDFVLGEKDSDITIVEYFDYNCGWCKRAFKEIIKLTASDSKIRVVLKELPIFGKHSEQAAFAAMAARQQGKYWDYHTALMNAEQVDADNIFKIAERVGIDIKKLKFEMANPKYATAVKNTRSIAMALGIEGTPGFIIDGKVNPGFLPLTQLKAAIAEVRKSGCKFC
ncbi:MAG: DsbA family protein [Hyphomicrobiaceae bacterium]|nr:DsbA family protein [Hyphomicrobiaceae bacterium]